ncbi:hypothetical protein BLNAU_25287 [Blattamonas nauphoetae]|uniref:Uncharacterized protein n=1 Tax=Blattamonas nauphoetae TaxID=2049346 RepID=A0ABQ9WJZ2_9EUKA|nr:hypothetical protein BLNAU_25287 [Blattamonas nauphoetae]
MCGSMPGKRDNVCSSSTDHSACVPASPAASNSVCQSVRIASSNANPSPSQTREPTRVSTPAYKMQRNAWLCHRQNASMNARMHGANGQGVGMRQPRIRMRHTLPDEVWGTRKPDFLVLLFGCCAERNIHDQTGQHNVKHHILHQSMPTLLIWCGKRKHRWKRASELVPTRSCRVRCSWTLSALKTVDRPLQSRDGNEDTPITEDDEMPENEPVDSNCMSKCRLHNMPICISEFDGCYFSCKDDEQSHKVWKEGDTEGLAAEMGRLNDFEKVRKMPKNEFGRASMTLTRPKRSTTKTERLKQQGEELKKKADEFRQRAETIKREAERHAANLKKERDEMWKTGKEEIEHARRREGSYLGRRSESEGTERESEGKPRRGRWLASTI